MYSKSKNYWFTIEPYTYTHIKKNEVILLNTLNGCFIRSSNGRLKKLIKKTQTEENLSVSLLNGYELKDSDFLKIIKRLRENFMIDIIDTTFSNGKPIQFISRSNLIPENLSYRQKLLDSQEENILSYLNEIVLIINSYGDIKDTLQIYTHKLQKYMEINVLSFDSIKEFCKNVLRSNANKIKVVGVDIASHPEISDLINYFLEIDISIEFEFPGLNINYSLWNGDHKKTIIIPANVANESINSIKQIIPSYKSEKYKFIVESEKHLHVIETILSIEGIFNYQILPSFNGTNIKFFEKYVFIDESDQCSVPQSLKNIHSRHVLNTNDFGKLTIMPDRKVYANPYFPALGNIEDDIRELIYKELTEGQSWLRIRDMKPCCDCIYQWLCPSPGNYELAIGKPNLCHIKP